MRSCKRCGGNCCALCCGLGVPHLAVWAPCYNADLLTTGRISEQALAYSRASSTIPVSNYSAWRNQAQPMSEDPAFMAILAELGGPKVQQLRSPDHYFEERQQCAKCGEEELVIEVTRGETISRLRFCECQFSADQLAHRRATEQRAAAVHVRLDRKAEEARQAGLQTARLKDDAAKCEGFMVRQFGKCTDAGQKQPECVLCPQRRKSGKQVKWSDKRRSKDREQTA